MMKKVMMMAALLALTTSSWAQNEETVVTPPVGLETETYVAILTTTGGETYYQNVQVGIYNGTEAYFQGLAYNGVPESWAKGTIATMGPLNIISFPKTFLGTYSYMGAEYKYYLNETTFLYNEGVYSAPAGYSISGGIGAETYNTATLKKLVEKEATPAKPSLRFGPSYNGSTYMSFMTIPLIDTNGDPLLSDKLSYVFYYVKDDVQQELTFTKDKYKKLTEDMTEIPYNFTDKWDIDNYEIWMNQGEGVLKTWTKLGLQSIYRGLGVEHRSEIDWFDMDAYWKGSSGIEDVKSDNGAKANVFYDLRGQRVDKPTKGLYIVNGRKVVIK